MRGDGLDLGDDSRGQCMIMGEAPGTRQLGWFPRGSQEHALHIWERKAGFL